MQSDRIHRRAFGAASILVLATAVLLLAISAAVRAADDGSAQSPSVEQWIQQLGDDRYELREEAQSTLAERGFEAYEALEAAAKSEDLEIATRAKYLLRLIRVQWVRGDDPPEVKKLLDDYGDLSAAQRWERVRQLGRLPDAQGIDPICRVVRFEGSEMLSKYAALEILERRPFDAREEELWAKAIETSLSGHASRPAARWLVCCLRMEEEPDAAIAEWTALAEAEAASVDRVSRWTSANLAVMLFYYLAEAEADAGRQLQADQTAARARSLISDADNTTAAYLHWAMAVNLQRRGLFRWAEGEYREIIDSDAPEFQARGRIMLSEMKHDQGDDQGAAELLDGLLQIDRRQMQIALAQAEQTPAQVQARRDYFRACHCEKQGDDVGRREYLDLALASDPSEIDVLIACYHLTDVDAEYHAKIVNLIGKTAARMRRDAKAEPDESSGYNQLAWLLGNTEDTDDEAITMAKKAVEMSPDSGAYYDTLAHAYFGNGDFENAVKCQTKAAALDPHSGLIKKKLAVFRQKLEASKITTKP